MAPRKKKNNDTTKENNVTETVTETDFDEEAILNEIQEKEAAESKQRKPRQKTNWEDLFSNMSEVQTVDEEPPSGLVSRKRERVPTPFDEPLLESYLKFADGNELNWAILTVPTTQTDEVRRVLGQVATALTNTTDYEIGVETKFEPDKEDPNLTKLWFRARERTKRTRHVNNDKSNEDE